MGPGDARAIRDMCKPSGTVDAPDHLPVWAEFSALEAVGPSDVATRPGVRR